MSTPTESEFRSEVVDQNKPCRCDRRVGLVVSAWREFGEHPFGGPPSKREGTSDTQAVCNSERRVGFAGAGRADEKQYPRRVVSPPGDRRVESGPSKRFSEHRWDDIRPCGAAFVFENLGELRVHSHATLGSDRRTASPSR